MTVALNPFLVSLAVALLVLGAIVVSSHRQHQMQALVAGRGPREHAGSGGLSMPALVLALPVMLVPFGIAFAAIWGPPVAMGAYLALLIGGVIARRISPRFRH